MARILDLTSETGAYGTRLLAELGHDVVRVEPVAGDVLRRSGPYLGATPDLESGAYHQYFNAGKRSFTPNLESQDGKRLLLSLVAKADAVVASLPLPVDQAALLEANPDLVLIRLDDGPPELCAYARSGLLLITGEPGSAPVLMGGHAPLAAIGTYLAIAAASALLAWQVTGKGQIVDVSAQECLNVLCEQAMIYYDTEGEVMERRGARGGITAVAGALPCADGHWMVSVPPNKDGWANFTQWIPDPMFTADPALVSEAMRKEKKDLILDRVAAWSTKHKKDDLVVEAQRRHIPASPVTTPLDLVCDPQLLTRGFLQPIDHPKFGKMNFPIGALAQLWGGKPKMTPLLGEDNAAILAEIGYSAAEIETLFDIGAV